MRFLVFVKAIKKTELSSGEGKSINLKGKNIAIFNVDGKFFAIDNACAHMGGPLGEGFLSGNVVTCPWHAWKYDVTTGKSVVVPTIQVKKYNTKIEGTDVLVEV